MLRISRGGILGTDMRFVPLGSGGAILELEWFLNYHDIKLVIQASAIEGNIGLLDQYKTLWLFLLLGILKIELIPEN